MMYDCTLYMCCQALALAFDLAFMFITVCLCMR